MKPHRSNAIDLKAGIGARIGAAFVIALLTAYSCWRAKLRFRRSANATGSSTSYAAPSHLEDQSGRTESGRHIRCLRGEGCGIAVRSPSPMNPSEVEAEDIVEMNGERQNEPTELSAESRRMRIQNAEQS